MTPRFHYDWDEVEKFYVVYEGDLAVARFRSLYEAEQWVLEQEPS